MVFLVIGDPHFKPENALETNILHKETVKIADKYEFIVVLGDILHTHNKADLHTFVRSCKWLFDLSSKTKTYLLIGNHDRINNKVSYGDDHFFFPLKGHRNLVIVDRPYQEIIGNDKFTFMPYTEPGLFLSIAKKFNVNLMDSKAIFAHQEFKGSINKNDGDIWPENAPKIISGHIHEYKKVSDNVLYVGTPFMLSYGCTKDKGVYRFDDELNDIRLSLPIPKKITIEINADKFWDTSFSENTYLRIKITGTAKQKNIIINSDKFKELMSNKMIKVVFMLDSGANEIMKISNPEVSKTFVERVKNYLVTDDLKTIFKSLLD